MHCVSYAATAISVFVGAQAMQLGVHGVGQVVTKDHEWLKSITTQGSMNCSVDNECVVGVGMGACRLEVDPAEPVVVGPTDSGYECEMASNGNTIEYPWKPFTHQDDDLTIIGHTESSHWNICWTRDKHTHRRAVTQTPNVADYCHYVNDLCFLWASPCSGGCSTIDPSSFTSFCPTLRYATEAEFSAALPTIDTIPGRAAFWPKCAATVLDPYFVHCDFMNDFARVPDGHWNELVLVCPGAVQTGGAGGGAGSATGDPHLQNVHGERFDLMKLGKHVLIHIPRGEPAEKALLRVEAEARRLGGQCADTYFQEINITGAWANARQSSGLSLAEAGHTGGLFISAQGVRDEHPDWMKFGKVELKVVHGRTEQGLSYLNFYVKHLGRTGLAVGGLLGEDDHTEEETPAEACVERLSLVQSVDGDAQHAIVSVAEASFD